jgi:hypothetical protein
MASADANNYTVVATSMGATGGRYTSKSGPAAAAKKAASQRLRKGSGSKITLTVRQLGSDKEFKYEATRVKLAKPVVRKIKGVTVTSEYEIKIKSA